MCFTRHQQGTEKMSVRFRVHQFCTLCTQAVPLFLIFEECMRFLWRKGKTKKLCICLWFQTSHAACVGQKLFFQCWSSLFLELGFQSVFVVPPLSPFFTGHLAKEQSAQCLCTHSSNPEDLQIRKAFRECLPCIISNTLTVVKKWYELQIKFF